MKERTKEIFGNWKYMLLGLGVICANIGAVSSIGTFPDNQVLVATILIATTVAAAYLAYRLDLWKGEEKGSFLKALAYVGCGTVVMFIVKIIGGTIISMEGGGLPANEAAIRNADIPLVVLCLFTVLLAPMIEELFFRGILMGKIFGRRSILGLIVSSFLFGLVHVPTTIGAWVVYGGMGMVLGLAYHFSGKFSYSYALHFINNLYSFVLIQLFQLFLRS